MATITGDLGLEGWSCGSVGQGPRVLSWWVSPSNSCVTAVSSGAGDWGRTRTLRGR